jgi:hypothetical protein
MPQTSAERLPPCPARSDFGVRLFVSLEGTIAVENLAVVGPVPRSLP